MEYIYAALLLHKLGKPINAESIMKVMQSAGAQADEGKIKSLVASLKDIDINRELENAVVASAVSAPGAAAKESSPAEEPKEEKKEAAAEGLSALFG